MNELQFVIIDCDYKSRNSLATILSSRGYVVQVDNVAELGHPLLDNALVFVTDRDGEAEATCAALHDAGIFYPVIAYSEAPSIAHVIDRVHGSCAGYLGWPCEEPELWRTLDVLTKTSAGRIRRRVVEARARHKLAQLTKREQQVAAGIMNGMSSKELAIQLGISYRTVELHRANIMSKFGTRNMASLIRTLVEAGEPADAEQTMLPLH